MRCGDNSIVSKGKVQMIPKLKRVLIVDESPDTLNFLVRTVQKTGLFYTIESAHTGEEAIRRMTEMPPDLIVMHHNLPDKTTWDICEYKKNVAYMRSTKILVASGQMTEALRDKLLKSGVTETTHRPIGAKELTTLIQRLAH